MKKTEGKVALLSQEHISLAENSKMGIEKERHKRLELFKKIHKLNTDEFDKINTKLDSDRLDHASFAREVMMVREIIDELFYKRYGLTQNSSPSKILSSCHTDNNSVRYQTSYSNRDREETIFNTNKTLSSFYVPGFEKVSILDQLSTRVALLEQELMGGRSSHSPQYSPGLSGGDLNMSMGLRSGGYGVGGSGHGGRLSLLEDKVRELEREEAKETLKKKLKELGESTAKACQSLSSGLAEVQQINLGLMTWADKAHTAIGICADKLGFQGNPCPPIPTHSSMGMNGAIGNTGISQSSIGGLHMSRSLFSNSLSDTRRRTYGQDS